MCIMNYDQHIFTYQTYHTQVLQQSFLCEVRYFHADLHDQLLTTNLHLQYEKTSVLF
jgi:hypothetical protein